AILPTKGSRMAAGHDLYALNDIPIPSKGQALVETSIAIGLPKGTYGRLASRSGLASKEGIEVGAGVIDADYTGELRVLLRNHSSRNYQIRKGERIAQSIITQINDSDLKEVKAISHKDRAD